MSGGKNPRNAKGQQRMCWKRKPQIYEKKSKKSVNPLREEISSEIIEGGSYLTRNTNFHMAWEQIGCYVSGKIFYHANFE